MPTPFRHQHRRFKHWLKRQAGLAKIFPAFPTYDGAMQARILREGDPIRHSTHALAIRRLEREKIPGAFAEVGVYRGDTSAIIHALAPERDYYLFDTFEGFPEPRGGAHDTRFRNTSLDLVKQRIGNLDHLVFRKGFFPETAAGLESESFAFVLLDLDKYEPALEGLRFFYPRLSRGAYLFVHDYNSPESEWGCSRALNEFLCGKPEHVVEVADQRGSALIRKV